VAIVPTSCSMGCGYLYVASYVNCDASFPSYGDICSLIVDRRCYSPVGLCAAPLCLVLGSLVRFVRATVTTANNTRTKTVRSSVYQPAGSYPL
jgi:hypothetical protein